MVRPPASCSSRRAGADHRRREQAGRREDRGLLADTPQVVTASDPFRSKTLSKDGRTAYATVTYDVGAKELTDASRSRLEEAARSAQDAGLTVEIGGKALDSGGGPGARPS